MGYKCLACGSLHGDPGDEGYEQWYWRILQFGRLGPFCSESCNREFRSSGQAGFTLLEWERLRFLKWRVLSGEVVEQGAGR